MRARFSPLYLLAIPLLCLVAFGVYNIPFVHEKLAWRVDNFVGQVKYAINPPEEVVFVPQEQNLVEQIVQATLDAAFPSATLTPMATFTSTATRPGPTATPAPTATETPSPTPIPASVRLTGVKYEDQHNRWNYCGPANLSMALTYWGWNGNRDVVGQAIKPHDNDKNIMPYEMVDFVNNQVEGLGALSRVGGDIDLLRLLIASGFPVVAEKGYFEYDYSGKLSWMGHYQFITGYDDAAGVLIVQDTYNDGPNFEIAYDDFMAGWRAFNYIFLLTYPFERQSEVLALLGPWADADWANQHALQVAQAEIQTLSDVDLFFAWFNAGTSHVNLREYYDATSAYDYAFSLFQALPYEDQRLDRVMWYQTGPYWAYYYTNRFQDVISLADFTVSTAIRLSPDHKEPGIEETYYWRGLAKLALGDNEGAIADLRSSLVWHPGFGPSLAKLEELGVTP